MKSPLLQEDVNLELCALLRIDLAMKEEQGDRRGQKERTREQEETLEEQENIMEGQRDGIYEQGTAMAVEKSEEYYNQSKVTDSQAFVPIGTTGKLVVSGEISIEELQLKLDSMLEHFDDGEKKWKCVVCGKVSLHKAHMRSHNETHIEGMSHPCNQCGKVFRSNNSLTTHVYNFHRK